jgi:tRNA modification GTPase
MQGKLLGWNDTIVAIATPQGLGAIGIIRLSGKTAFIIANQLFVSKNLLAQASHTIHVGLLKHNNIVLDEAIVSLFKGPKSYTGEDVVEISCHGSPYILQQVVLACTALGARLAKPGEFTQRAFLNGKLDLAQAEGVADLIASNSEASRQTALNHIRGGFSHGLKQMREELIRFSALIELELDFSQEDVEFADRSQLVALINQIAISTHQLLQSFRLGNVIKNGVQVAIIGRPNAGKSTLLNALLKEDRAIVSDIAGTTRDTIEEILNIDGILFRLIDTAGIRNHSTDTIENIGMEKSREKMLQADVVLLIEDAAFDGSNPYPISLLQELQNLGKPYLLIWNKADLVSTDRKIALQESSQNALMLVAKSAEGIEELKQRLFKLVISGNLNTEDTIITNARHYAALQKVAESIEAVQSGLQVNTPIDLLAIDIRQALHYLGEITGEITHEDQLDYIFSKFCIGK